MLRGGQGRRKRLFAGVSGPSGPPLPTVVDLDFANDVYVGASSSDIAVSNASGGYAPASSGLLVAFPPNTLRRTDLGLLVEESRTNLVSWSDQFSKPEWNLINTAAVTDNAVVAPDGTPTASRMIGQIPDSGKRIDAFTPPGVHTFSVYLKRPAAAPPLPLRLFIRHATNDFATVMVTNTWQRFSITTTTTTPDPTLQIGGSSTWGVGQEIHAWGAQLEPNAFALSPIRTTGAVATRASDNAELTLGAAPTEGTLYVEFVRVGPGPQGRLFSLGNNTLGNLVEIFQNSGGGLGRIVNGGSQQFAFGTANNDIGVRHKAAFSFSTVSGSGFSLDGGLLTSSNTNVPAATRLGIGVSPDGSNPANAFIRRVALLSTPLYGIQLRALTT
jgi:hypothetical protein